VGLLASLVPLFFWTYYVWVSPEVVHVVPPVTVAVFGPQVVVSERANVPSISTGIRKESITVV